MNNSKIIIIGDDHINTLGVIRTFGENNVKPYVFAISEKANISIVKSKYIKKYWICNISNLISLLIENFKDEIKKPIIITTSDKTASLLDKFYNQLADYFIIANINKKEGLINYYMDKFNQYELATKYDMPSAATYRIKFNDTKEFNEKSLNLNLKDFPYIIKPIISAKGNKDDIIICINNIELFKGLKNFKEKDYDEIIIQKFLDYDYELDISGFCYNSEVYIPGVIKKERIWPQKKGSTTLGQVLSADKYINGIKKIKTLLKSINYDGIFDIDVFIKDNEMYLNEINFRNGALSYAYDKSYVCYNWYKSHDNLKINIPINVSKSYYFINELSDFHNVLEKNITFKEYLCDKKKSKIKLVNNKYDIKPFFCIVKNKLFK